MTNAAFVDKTPLFESGNGWPCYRIPGIIVTARGTLIAYCETRTEGSDWATRGVAARRSVDGGQTWEPMQQLVQHETATINNPVMIADENGTVHLLWVMDYLKLHYQYSTDDGLTFSPVRVVDVFEGYRAELDWTILAVGPGHGIQMSNGALIVPAWLAKGEGRDHFPSTVACIRSDDHGDTWQRSVLVVPEAPEFDSPNETAVAECADGTLIYSVRNRGTVYRRYIMRSDDGLAFTQPVADDTLADPRCFGSIARAGDAIVHVNCDSESLRTLLTLRLSHDQGHTWPISRVLEADKAGYADVIFSADGQTGYCLYETSDGDWPNRYPQTLCLARFSIDWLKAGN